MFGFCKVILSCLIFNCLWRKWLLPQFNDFFFCLHSYLCYLSPKNFLSSSTATIRSFNPGSKLYEKCFFFLSFILDLFDFKRLEAYFKRLAVWNLNETELTISLLLWWRIHIEQPLFSEKTRLINFILRRKCLCKSVQRWSSLEAATREIWRMAGK